MTQVHILDAIKHFTLLAFVSFPMLYNYTTGDAAYLSSRTRLEKFRGKAQHTPSSAAQPLNRYTAQAVYKTLTSKESPTSAARMLCGTHKKLTVANN